jgi:hypothetical protein
VQAGAFSGDAQVEIDFRRREVTKRDQRVDADDSQVRERQLATDRGGEPGDPGDLADVGDGEGERPRAAGGVEGRGVGTMPRPLRVTSGSPRAPRKRASALLTAEGVTWSRAAARATLRSASTVCSTSIRLRSIDVMLTDGDLTHHESSLPGWADRRPEYGYAENISVARRGGCGRRVSPVFAINLEGVAFQPGKEHSHVSQCAV